MSIYCNLLLANFLYWNLVLTFVFFASLLGVITLIFQVGVTSDVRVVCVNEYWRTWIVKRSLYLWIVILKFHSWSLGREDACLGSWVPFSWLLRLIEESDVAWHGAFLLIVYIDKFDGVFIRLRLLHVLRVDNKVVSGQQWNFHFFTNTFKPWWRNYALSGRRERPGVKFNLFNFQNLILTAWNSFAI